MEMLYKACKTCKNNKHVSEFYSNPRLTSGLENNCKQCYRAAVVARRNRHINEAHSYDYMRQRESFTRIFKHRHRNMRQRVEGRRKDRTYVVFGTEIVTQQEFLDWCRTPAVMKQFFRQWIDWYNSGYHRALTPSIDRIDDNGTYVVGNMQWLPLTKNAQLGAKRKGKMA